MDRQIPDSIEKRILVQGRKASTRREKVVQKMVLIVSEKFILNRKWARASPDLVGQALFKIHSNSRLRSLVKSQPRSLITWAR